MKHPPYRLLADWLASLLGPPSPDTRLTLVDGGAARGLPPHWEGVRPYLRVIGFEPDERSFNKLIRAAAPSFRYLPVALGRTKGVVTFYLTKKRSKSSVFKPDPLFFSKFPGAERLEIVREEEMLLDTLDHQLRAAGASGVDFIKLDIQGGELAALRGGAKTLSGPVFGIEVEVEFTPVYRNQPLFADVDTFLRPYGFELFDLRPYYWKRKIGLDLGNPKGQLIYADALYLRNAGHFAALLGQDADQTSPAAAAVKAIAICLLYGYHDYALEVADQCRAFFDQKEIEALVRSITSSAPAPMTGKWSRLPGSRTLAKILSYTSRLLEKPRSAREWRLVGQLGNINEFNHA